MLSVISGPATNPSTSDKVEAGGLMATSHDREFLTINLIDKSPKEKVTRQAIISKSFSN